MSLSLIVGVGVIAFLFLFIAFKLDEEHGILRFAFIIFSMGLLFIIPGSVVQEQEVCEVVLYNITYQYGNNFTGYHWDYDTGTAPDGPQVDAYLFHEFRDYEVYCYNATNGGVGLVKAVKYPYWLFIAYIIIYLFYKALMALGKAGSSGRITRIFKSFKR